VLTGSFGSTSNASGCIAVRAIGVKSRNVLYGSFEYRPGLITITPVFASISV
jgi:hypothetical protein